MPLIVDPPLPPRVLAVLLALADGPVHGYALLKRLEERPDLGPRPGPTTLYRMLHELEDAGLLTAAGERPSPSLDDERRRYFALTVRGGRVLASELARLERVVAAARGWPAPEAGR
jgi:DNA-binding PadR family transcriptional regulator